MKFICFLIILPLALSCTSMEEDNNHTESSLSTLDIQGHRGARGLYPENSLIAFTEAVKIGVTTVEMDVTITKDKLVIVSHDPYLSSEFCLDSSGNEIKEKDEKNYNLFQMTFEEIKKCDCGSKVHPRFPDQKKIKVYKPLLSEVIDSVEKTAGARPIYYNIEIKATPEGDNIFHPAPEEFIKLVIEVIERKKIWDRTTLQSFDPRILQILKQKFKPIKLSFLVETPKSIEEQIKLLGFFPDIYSPEYILVTPHTIEYAHQHQMKVIPWTMNTIPVMQKMIEMGVDGIITDYPDRALTLIKELGIKN
jgi:glycerophosphoryl diester phosphodiesterase